ncbi:hypothetical protein [Grimontia sp. NTOU-MAR1]|uniref:hypothetical protein n=1 Tax=Grimontia sp. NTOU-MAR1 TaxID=3111011 RepID=UPI002DB767BC|nr:hypothetical protein [Grimontia sp. NTOU-MAR1]WRV98251.1 hypothetical protein VP504_02100 [Grimontia sp. NTOU-MAR1]
MKMLTEQRRKALTQKASKLEVTEGLKGFTEKAQILGEKLQGVVSEIEFSTATYKNPFSVEMTQIRGKYIIAVDVFDYKTKNYTASFEYCADSSVEVTPINEGSQVVPLDEVTDEMMNDWVKAIQQHYAN